MQTRWDVALKKALAVGAICLILAGQNALAQNLGAAPQSNVAVQGETGARSRPFKTHEGALRVNSA